MNKDPKLHLGHFQRIRDRVLRDNAENFDDTLVRENSARLISFANWQSMKIC